MLPALSIATFSGIGTIYFLRQQVIEGKGSDYAMTANSKGVPENRIFWRHILRNSLVPFAPTIGGIFFSLFSGSILIESIFTFPGMGQLFFSSLVGQDFQVVMSLVVIYSVLGVLGVLSGDIVLTLVDPRIRIK